MMHSNPTGDHINQDRVAFRKETFKELLAAIRIYNSVVRMEGLFNLSFFIF
jgi:hypothetical protein